MSKSHKDELEGVTVVTSAWRATRTLLAVTEEALRVVVLERLQTVWTPEKERDVRDAAKLVGHRVVSRPHLVSALLVTSYLTVRRHIFSLGNSRGPSTLSSCPSVSKNTSRQTHRREN